jgi:UPF0716 family protein affecting phage T7 exclusion
MVMENLSYDQLHTSTQSTKDRLIHVGIIIVAVAVLITAGLVGTFLGRMDVLTVALVDMRQSCLEQPK